MKINIFFIYLLLVIFPLCAYKTKKVDWPVLKGPYLGQKPPGKVPEIFAPGLITTYHSQSYIVFLHEARFCVYSTSTEKGHETYYTFEKKGRWTSPQRAPFEELQGHPNYTTGPRGRKVYFHSGRQTFPDDNREDDNIWTIEWTGSRWAKPQALPEPANSEYGEAYPSAAIDGTVFFFTWNRTGTRGYDIWLSRCIDGKYQEAERLPWPINTDFIEYDPYVAPDQSFLIFGSTRPGGFGKSDNYICFHKKNGNWTSPLNLGRPINSSSYDLCANGTPDGKYFFFTSGRKTDVNKGSLGKKTVEETGEDSDLYWVNFNFINELKNTAFTKQNAAEIIKRKYRENGIQSAVHTLETLYSKQKNYFYFPPYELLYLTKTLLAGDRTEDADLFVSALAKVLSDEHIIKEGYGRICALNGFVTKGLKIFEELASQDPAFDIRASLSSLGYLFTLYPDKSEDALSLLRFTVKKFPDDWFPYYSLARIHRKLGNLDKAIKNCQKALEIRPMVGDVSQLLQRLLEEKKQEQNQNQEKSFPILKGPYLGQEPPGMIPEIFAPGIISTQKKELNSVFSPKGDEFFFSIYDPKPIDKCTIMYSKQINGIWSKPEVAPFSGKYIDVDMAFSPDGNKLFFCSNRPKQSGSIPNPKHDIWYVTRKSDGWTEPTNLGTPINSLKSETYPIFSKNWKMYFASSRRGGKGGKDVYFSQLINGKFSKPVNLGSEINTPYGEGDTFVAPDESYLIVSSWGRPDTIGGGDLYISFKNNDNNWTTAKNMGKPINTNVFEYCPMVTPDGKYLFFSRFSEGKSDIYWMDAVIINELKQKQIK